MIKIALAGNPNSGKSTLFNALTGSNQYVGNWPGVTVEKKEGKLKGHKDVTLMDLPGIYSLSPYTLEEVVSRNYLIDEHPNVVINIVDGSNLERNLYLSTQLTELGIPMIIAINMMDIVRKNGDIIDIKKLSKAFNCEVVELSALKNDGVTELIEKSVELAKNPEKKPHQITFTKPLEMALDAITSKLPTTMDERLKRWYAIKLFERDEKVEVKEGMPKVEKIIEAVENDLEDDSESLITSERYDFITEIIQRSYTKKNTTGMTTSDKIDRIITNRFLGLPIFALIMVAVYYVAVTTVGTILTDFTNDTLVAEWVSAPLQAWMEGVNVAPWLTSLIVDGIVGGVGAVIGFVPQLLVLFFLLSILEECGYMSRVAFIMDRAFRKFGLSGKSFIPMLIGTGCGVPGIMASRTIENDRDRKITIMTTTFMPCSAKMPIVAMIAGALFGGVWWVAPSAYFVGILAVVISGVMLKKMRAFAGNPAPFVMELPAYHLPTAGIVLKSTWERGWSFIKRAGSLILLASILIWFLSSFGVSDGGFGMVDEIDASILAGMGSLIAPIFAPLGFGQWQATVATVMGLMAKEEVVGVFGVLYGVSGDAMELVEEGAFSSLGAITAHFTALSAYSFLVFNLLCAPCFAAIGAIKREMNNPKWTIFAVGYQCVFAYAMALMVYQFGMLAQGVFGWQTIFALLVFAATLYLIFRPQSGQKLLKKAALES